jgi:hypothetical protein
MALAPGQIPYSPMSPQMLSPRHSVRNTYYNPHQNPNDQNAANSAYARQSFYTQPQQNAIEMPGSYCYAPPPPNPAYLQSHNNRYSAVSELSATSPRQASFSDSTSPHTGGGASPHIGSHSPGIGSSEYSSTTATSELPSQPGGYLRPMGSPGLVADRDRYSVVSEMPTSRE